MPFDANGNFGLVPGAIVSEGMNVLPSQHNPPFLDVANGLSMVILRDGRAPWTGNQDANGNRITGLGDAVGQGDAVTLRQLNDATSGGDGIDTMYWLAATL